MDKLRTILPAWFVHLEAKFFFKEVHFKHINRPPVKTGCPLAENV